MPIINQIINRKILFNIIPVMIENCGFYSTKCHSREDGNDKLYLKTSKPKHDWFF